MSYVLRFKFWILIAAILAVAVLGYFMVYRKAAGGNDEGLQQIASTRSSIESAQKRDVRGQGWQEAFNEIAGRYEEQKDTIQHLVSRGEPHVIVGEVSDWRGLCLKLTAGQGQAPIAEHLASLMVDPVRERIEDTAEEIREARDQTGVSLTAGRAYPVVAPDLKMDLVREINFVLQRPDFYRAELWADQPLVTGDAEDLRALAQTAVPPAEEGEEATGRDEEVQAKLTDLENRSQRIRGLLARVEQLSEKDRFWLNRLLLEAALPAHIQDSNEREKFHAAFRYLTVPDPNLYQYTGLWKGVYATRVQQLYSQLEEDMLGFGSDSLDVASYTETYIPSETEMEWQEQAYWIQRYLVDAIGDLNDVPQESPVMTEEERLSVRRRRLEEDRYVVPLLRSIRFAPQPERLYHYSHSESFRPLAIDITLIMRGRYLSLVQNALIQNVPTLEVTGMRVNRYGSMPVMMAGANGPDTMRDTSRPSRYERGERISLSGFRLFPYRELEVEEGEEAIAMPSDTSLDLRGKLVEVELRCYIREGEPDGELLPMPEPDDTELIEYE